ncbi:purple acid phosphatase family protein [Neolewinella agarilytica]|uniref:purple acid phosphatase family protein n=1 Tax=Neolewinella agarilytica TaxID=478744 RepID=UPI001587D642|nr:metallophosphoesterase family protein [Neolewinella agarilytica]
MRPQNVACILRPRLMLLLFLPVFLYSLSLDASTRRYRLTWREDPATSMVIGFEQPTGSSVKVVYDTQDHGRATEKYRFTASPSRQVNHAGMRNVFVRIKGLQPGTIYYFLVVDSDGASQRMLFETPHNTPDKPLSIIAGGDSRNNRDVAQSANRLVSKLKPHFVLFGGDMTNGDTAAEWQDWFDDWQLTISSDGRLTPIVPARGNHERSNASIYNLFDVPNPDVYYALSFAGGLLRTYTLNTLFPPGGDQLDWLENDLSRSKSSWKIAQYHHSMRPHTSAKPERDELITLWATRFTKYGMNLVCESDVHTVKQTWPIRPSRELGASQGFIRDDRYGTVYVGEGCWGAPLRANDDNKPWTRASGRFNQFKWLWVGLRQIQIRTVDIDRSSYVVNEVDYLARFKSPAGMYYWDADNGGDVLRIQRRAAGTPPVAQGPLPAGRRPGASMQSADKKPILSRDAQNRLRVNFQMPAAGSPTVLVFNSQMRLLWQKTLSVRGPGPYSENLQLPSLPRGERLQMVVKGAGRVLGKFEVR